MKIYAKTKRMMDILLSLLLIILTLPLLIIISILNTIFFKGKIFFIQLRPGVNEQLFKIIKFKTMLDAKDINGHFLPDSQRMTRWGNFLRNTSLDEMPELINVLIGDMSFIGPRPLLEEYLPLYSEEQRARHKISPGITGLAQISGRNQLSWDDKFKLDIYYVQNYSFLLDCKILLATLYKVLIRDGVNAEGEATVKKFEGAKNK